MQFIYRNKLHVNKCMWHVDIKNCMPILKMCCMVTVMQTWTLHVAIKRTQVDQKYMQVAFSTLKVNCGRYSIIVPNFFPLMTPTCKRNMLTCKKHMLMCNTTTCMSTCLIFKLAIKEILWKYMYDSESWFQCVLWKTENRSGVAIS